MSNDRQRQDLPAVFMENRDRLRDAARRVVGTADIAEDILQSAYLRISEASDHLLIRQPVNYCFQVVRHLAIDHCRRRTLERQFFVGELQGEAVPASHSSPEVTAMSGQFLVRVSETLGRLPARTREAFELYRLEGLTQRAIAERLGVSPTLVNFMIRDAVEALKDCRDGADR